MEGVSCAANLFTYEEDKAVPMKTFYSFYRSIFPLLAVIKDGHYGETKFDCFENLQVIRVHCYSSQERVMCTDSRAAYATDNNYYTIPINTEYKFKKIKGHTSEGEPQSLKQILDENELPVMVKLACHPASTIKVGSCRLNVGGIGNLLITEKYIENYLMINCIDKPDLKMNSEYCLMALSDKITATPITGFRNRSQAEYQEYLKQLAEQVATSGQVYDKTAGDPAFAKYRVDEDNIIYEMPPMHLGVAPVPPTAQSSEDSDSDYEHVTDPPLVPTRQPKSATSGIETGHSADKARETKQHKKFSSMPKFLKNMTKSKQKPKVHEKDETPPIPKKPDVKVAKIDTVQIKDGSRPYENRQISQAVVRPMAKSQKTVAKAEPLSLPEPAEDDTEDIYNVPTDYTEPVITAKMIDREPESLLKNSTSKEDDDDDGEMYYLVGEVFDRFKPSKDTTLTISKTHAAPAHQSGPSPCRVAEQEQSVTDRGHQDPGIAHTAGPAESVPPEECTTDDDYVEVVERGHGDMMKNRRLPVPPEAKAEDTIKKPRASDGDASSETKTFDIRSFTIDQVIDALRTLNLEKYADAFREDKVDGEILFHLQVDDMVSELNMRKIEAVRLQRYIETGHIPK